ncbi:hypothetical protein GWK36_12865 [Caldichromatium japonicum]|uniref:Uncharacterized protein n=1 Tax=Caldichromatium japonicum TaxID=2699430 RepID=A0A6G7VF63_9GAMM|nr:hypothetical protein [Caldichromatium japonicum]QIK38723.1 hypothetical protein GWK36_12865 [Caldichromatium japonicum]
MKFAAKRTWPEKAPTWEHQAEAEDAESFALEFSMLEQLAVDTEFAVMQREGGQGVRFFRVVATDPYRLQPTASRQGTPAGFSAATTSAPDVSDSLSTETSSAADAPPTVSGLGAAISTIFYMGKVFVIATAIIAVLGIIITFIRRSFE